jgi:MFS family permease
MPSRSSSLGPAFSALLTATFVTNLGDGLRLTALPLLATTLTTSPLLISGITAAQFLPWTTFAPFGGVIVDRADRRRLIMVTQAWRSLVMAALGLAIVTDVVQIWHIFAVAFVITVGEILVDPSVVAMVPTLVAHKDLDRANSRISTVEIVTNNFAGGPIGAASFALVPWLPFLLDALSYLGSIAPFSRLPATRTSPGPVTPRSSVRVEMGDGLRWIKSHPFLRPLTAAIAVFHLGTAGAFSLLILLVTDVLEAPEIIFGIVLAAAAIGATVASLISARLADRFPRRMVMTAASVITGLSVIAAGVVTSQWQLIIVWTLNGAGGGVMLSIGRGFIQRHTPNDRLGRTAVASRMITRTSFVVGALLGGMIATTTSVRWAFVAAGSLHLVGSLLLWRSFREEPA